MRQPTFVSVVVFLLSRQSLLSVESLFIWPRGLFRLRKSRAAFRAEFHSRFRSRPALWAYSRGLCHQFCSTLPAKFCSRCVLCPAGWANRTCRGRRDSLRCFRRADSVNLQLCMCSLIVMGFGRLTGLQYLWLYLAAGKKLAIIILTDFSQLCFRKSLFRCNFSVQLAHRNRFVGFIPQIFCQAA